MPTITPLLAFHHDTKIKTKYLARVRKHREADQLVQGHGYWSDGKGCAVGCTLHSSNHAAYETELGIPMILARLEDRTFENLDKELARTWPERFLSAPRVGADLSMVWPKFALWLLVDAEDGVIKFAKTDKTRTAIQGVADLFARWIAGSKPPLEEWRRSRDIAYAAAYAYAAYAAAAYAAYAYAAYAAAAYAAAAYADAAAAYARSRARKKFFALASEKLLTLMAEAPVVEIL